MARPYVPLLTDSLRGWFSAKGFWLVAALALLPLLLTAAWAGTHRADLTIDAPAADVASPREGDLVNLTVVVRNDGPAVGTFNATLQVGTVYSSGRFIATETRTESVEGLESGASRTVVLNWTAEPGIWVVLAQADPEDAVAEVEEFNNQNFTVLAVGYRRADASEAPALPDDLAGDANATAQADLAVRALARGETLAPGRAGTFRATFANDGPAAVENATAVVRVGRVFSGSFVPLQETTRNLTLAPGATEELSVSWMVTEGAFWHQAYIRAPGDAGDPDAANNVLTEPFNADPAVGNVTAPEAPDRLTIKRFYVDMMSLIHLVILVPFIAIFYAAGVITDERERGTLPYLLTRPIPRWVQPFTKFAASFLVAAVALVIGLAGAYAVLFGTVPQGNDLGYLTTPLVATLAALFAYGAIATLIGVWSDRPYLVGVAFVLGWETIAFLFVPWVQRLTVKHYVTNVFLGWDPEQAGVQWISTDPGALWALLWLVGIGVAALAVASSTMKQREFEV